jgi:hypothetical protein
LSRKQGEQPPLRWCGHTGGYVDQTLGRRASRAGKFPEIDDTFVDHRGGPEVSAPERLLVSTQLMHAMAAMEKRPLAFALGLVSELVMLVKRPLAFALGLVSGGYGASAS